jgi:hypothetical protein
VNPQIFDEGEDVHWDFIWSLMQITAGIIKIYVDLQLSSGRHSIH